MLRGEKEEAEEEDDNDDKDQRMGQTANRKIRWTVMQLMQRGKIGARDIAHCWSTHLACTQLTGF